MKKNLVICSLLSVVLTSGIFLFIASLYAIGIASVVHLEMKMRSKKYYEPVAKDLAIICSNIETEPNMLKVPNVWNMIEVPNIWLPYSVVKLEPIRGYLSSQGASVFFTCGFSHLSYKLEKIQNDSENSNKWELYFEDEGRRKHLTTIELSGNESFDFDDMFGYGKWKYESQIQAANKLKRNTEIFLSLFGKTEKD